VWRIFSASGLVVGIAEVKGGKVCLERPEQGCWYHNSLCRGARTPHLLARK